MSRGTVPDLPAIIHVAWGPNVAAATASLASVLPEGAGPVPILAAPADRTNEAITEFRRALGSLGRRSTRIEPRTAVSSMLLRNLSWWRAVDAGDRHYRLDARLGGRGHILLLAITPELRMGPFVLDLPFTFLHPVDRMRLASRPRWRLLLADVAASALPALSILLAPVADGWLGLATEDPIAAELWALGLAERWLGDDIEMQGPWEEPAVQRATQLHLGARIPSDMRLSLIDGTPLPTMARELLVVTASRLGMPHLDPIE